LRAQAWRGHCEDAHRAYRHYRRNTPPNFLDCHFPLTRNSLRKV
jgi:hypothetical protein